MSLSAHFTLDEFIHSETASKHGIDNTPQTHGDVLENLKALCTELLDPLREKLGKPIKITSGYRCPALNKAVGGVANSQHVLGEAADLSVEGLLDADLAKMVVESGLPFDQCLLETSGATTWVHVSHRRVGTNRRQSLEITVPTRTRQKTS